MALSAGRRVGADSARVSSAATRRSVTGCGHAASYRPVQQAAYRQQEFGVPTDSSLLTARGCEVAAAVLLI